MTDRLKGCTVIFDNPIRRDDAEETIFNTISLIKGVAKVVPLVNMADDEIAVEKAKRELMEKIWEILRKY